MNKYHAGRAARPRKRQCVISMRCQIPEHSSSVSLPNRKIKPDRRISGFSGSISYVTAKSVKITGAQQDAENTYRLLPMFRYSEGHQCRPEIRRGHKNFFLICSRSNTCLNVTVKHGNVRPIELASHDASTHNIDVLLAQCRESDHEVSTLIPVPLKSLQEIRIDPKQHICVVR